MEHTAETQWMGNMQFNALYNGHTILMDAPANSGGSYLAPFPKPFVLTALCGCTGMNVVALLRKSGITLSNIEIKADGELSKQALITCTKIHLQYHLDSADEHAKAAIQAVTDFLEKYCGLCALLKKAIPVSRQIFYNSICLFNNKADMEVQNEKAL